LGSKPKKRESSEKTWEVPEKPGNVAGNPENQGRGRQCRGKVGKIAGNSAWATPGAAAKYQKKRAENLETTAKNREPRPKPQKSWPKTRNACRKSGPFPEYPVKAGKSRRKNARARPGGEEKILESLAKSPESAPSARKPRRKIWNPRRKSRILAENPKIFSLNQESYPQARKITRKPGKFLVKKENSL
jgi:hypothetical protein